MDGITVLNEYFIKSEFAGDFQRVGFILLSLTVILVYLYHPDYSKFSYIITSISALLGMVFILVGLDLSEKPSTIKEYQVTISDNVSMTEFMSEYDVIKVDGKIYTIREREK